MSNYANGHAAEQRAARYLEKLGYAILAFNWRTRYCEIDIISQKAARVYFVEVKYRRSDRWGQAAEYITAQKLAQMKFAAAYWLARHGWQGDAQLAVISIDGSTFKLEVLDV